MTAWVLGAATAATVMAAVASEARAQPMPVRPTAHRALAVRRAQVEWERAESEWRRTAALREREMASAAELEERDAARMRARLDLVREALDAMGEAPHLLIDRAVRRPLGDGSTVVTLLLRVAPAPGEELARAVAALAPEIRAELAGASTRRAYVSLKSAPGTDGTIVAAPYEHVVSVGATGERATATFRLVREVGDVVVSIDYGGRVEERRIVMESAGAALTLQALQPAQEGDLGAQVAYDLTLARGAEGTGGARVAVDGLPASVPWELREAASDARLTLVRFAAGEREKRLRLLVALPSDGAPDVHVDSALRFTVRAAAAGAGSTGDDARIALELTPRGVPRATLRLSTLYLELRAGDTVRVPGTVRNEGTRTLRDLRLGAEAPAGWHADVVQPPAGALAPGSEAPARIALAADAEAAPGDYELRVRVEGGGADRPLEAEPRVIRVRVREADDGRALRVALLLAAAAAVLIGWLARRVASR